MAIGILTFHSQLNYGGVLQCWALQTALEKLGHEVVVIDRWLDAGNGMLERGYDKWGVWQWAKFWMRSCMGLGDVKGWLRVRRTKLFLREHLHLTPYHFVDWKDAPRDLGVDALVVGSDQVWHCWDFGDPRAYLLEGAPEVPAVAYAASFGMVGIPEFLSETDKKERSEQVYRRGLSRFKAISCRESEGVAICGRLGFTAAHVADPTLLLGASDWKEGLGMTVRRSGRKCLVCYLLSEDVFQMLPRLRAFSKKTHCVVKVLLDSALTLPVPKNMNSAKRYLEGFGARLSSEIEILDSAGPLEFTAAFAGADWVVSDSFHALMFSLVFGCNARILAPKSEFRRMMFARIEEFAAHMDGQLVAFNLDGALDSLAKGEKVVVDAEWLKERIAASKEWLAKPLTKDF